MITGTSEEIKAMTDDALRFRSQNEIPITLDSIRTGMTDEEVWLEAYLAAPYLGGAGLYADHALTAFRERFPSEETQTPESKNTYRSEGQKPVVPLPSTKGPGVESVGALLRIIAAKTLNALRVKFPSYTSLGKTPVSPVTKYIGAEFEIVKIGEPMNDPELLNQHLISAVEIIASELSGYMHRHTVSLNRWTPVPAGILCEYAEPGGYGIRVTIAPPGVYANYSFRVGVKVGMEEKICE
jgi:hypothetical protein